LYDAGFDNADSFGVCIIEYINLDGRKVIDFKKNRYGNQWAEIFRDRKVIFLMMKCKRRMKR